MHELPLVFFTVLGQTAVGLFTLVWLSNKLGMTTPLQLKQANIVGLILVMAGLLIGTLHVGQPLRAINMLLGVGRSPMSNEILLSGLFVAMACGTVFFSTLVKNSLLAALCNFATVLVGLTFAWSITQVYQLTTVPNWDTSYTSLQLWMTVLVGGGAFAMLTGARQLGAIALLAGAIVTLVNKPGYLTFLGQGSAELSSQQTLFWGIQILLLVLGVFVAAAALLKDKIPRATLAVCASALIIGELAGRIAFYNLWQIPM
ncbi:DMSO reductase anchor subunit family protein [Yersinia pseudotuberculosis IP 32953]|uniref:Putative dimethyl sulfoxide reductase chain C protein n=1 Tax=Yersinia pseudotuberculosis serotype I (strain IP32953) TaxID=273123 RepID=Q668P7_YERPS|nr:dimethyl sulfoxide reductase anchor subunit family protein [Yersinia pseudotuberculosis]CQD57729.1 anaerobic dimethyl sulfoxide reductase subunit B [Yersinia intermedia]AJJ01013.1 DMSO reductase anchor subunit family protein [Yersinia pseudotuberculosis]AJJ54631.1 DMSO reductase anchor subunit family protein [Yersinia pseudotuberculosis IP 32953]AJJ66872.1 DMSO reductase anchor subunit family protein [Yersinia pseudotuberculosis PB1/+]AJJ71894.1 DMSO reductase anchor subunit family protein 